MGEYTSNETLTARQNLSQQFLASPSATRARLQTELSELKCACDEIPRSIQAADVEALGRAKTTRHKLKDQLTATCAELREQLTKSEADYFKTFEERYSAWNDANARLIKLTKEYQAAAAAIESELAALQPAIDSLNLEKTNFDAVVIQQRNEVDETIAYLLTLEK